MYYNIYNVICWLLFLTIFPLYAFINLIRGENLSAIKQRLGFFGSASGAFDRTTTVWVHAASVGEVQAAKAIITELQTKISSVSFVLTTVTRQGLLVAQKQLGEQVSCYFSPLDMKWIVKRFVKMFRPAVYLCLETELWPHMLKVADDCRMKIILLNGRISHRSYGRYLKIRPFMAEVINKIDAISVITDSDRSRFIALGAKPDVIQVNGNAKYDINYTALPGENGGNIETETAECMPDDLSRPETANSYSKLLQLTEQDRVMVAGSTHTGEEEILLASFLQLSEKINGLILILAPRHIVRINKIQEFLKLKKLHWQLLSELKKSSYRRANIVLVDTMGELSSLYAVADYVFCGGSLVSRGGHNIMEPAAWGVAPFYGPSMKDFADARELLEDGGAGFLVHSGDELTRSVLYFEKHQMEYQKACGKAGEIAGRQKGSAAKQAELVMSYLQAAGDMTTDINTARLRANTHN